MMQRYDCLFRPQNKFSKNVFNALNIFRLKVFNALNTFRLKMFNALNTFRLKVLFYKLQIRIYSIIDFADAYKFVGRVGACRVARTEF